MSYQLPKDIAEQFGVSLKTVYNYISKYPSKIRKKKEFWKTYVSFEDFEKAFQWNVQSYNMPSKNLQSPENKSETESQDWTLQNDYEYAIQKIEFLEKQNTNLQEHANTFAIQLREEKNEKKNLFEKFERLQNQYNDKVEAFSLERIKRLKRYNGILVLCVVVLIILAGFVLPDVLNFFLGTPTL